MREIRQMKDRSIVKPEVEEENQESEKLAALKIQKIWRGYVTRRYIRKRRLEEMLLIGNDRLVLRSHTFSSVLVSFSL